MTGIGGFLGAQDPGGYSAVTTHGLQTTAEGLLHLTPPGAAISGTPLSFNDTANNSRWATWVRGSLYLSEFLSRVSYEPKDTNSVRSIALSFDNHDLVELLLPSDALLAEQCSHVRDYADLRGDRGAEIVSQLGFPTEYFSMILGMHVAQHKSTVELITATQVVAAHMAMIAKHALAVRRPDQIDGRILPMIPTPGHGSFPSAHATEAYAVLTVLEALATSWGGFEDLDNRIVMMRGLAERIAVNRTVAGVHYPIDSWAGATLGTAIGKIILNLAGHTGVPVEELRYEPQNQDFSDFDFSQNGGTMGLHSCGQFQTSAAPHFSWLWDNALTETQKV
ncbi:phosphatase PAP2 family protein [Roseibium polysiphoniae]|uniref:Phosphatase PAP2 family protein n=2 Tax=Roseibium polysiphoniae TaxID=2571221 RepID=A0A944GSD5_9HYPH|nr:phosphatase PAP2 family protein [Roseibium polysiphoniae]